jgi:hypothetical protein
VNIQRWANIDGCMEPANDWGDWVKADEALARIAKLEAAIAELQEMVNVCEMDRNRALAELARLRPFAELYPLAWEECEKWRGLIGEHANNREWGCTDINGVWRWVAPADAHDKARADRGVGQ